MKSASDRPTRMVSMRAILRESSSVRRLRDKWNSALPRLPTMAISTITTRILMGSMGRHFILRAPMANRFSAYGRVFAPSWPMTLLTVALLFAFVALGRWQWHRGIGKQAVWAEYERPAAADLPVRHSIERVEGSFVPVALEGHYEPEHQFLLDNISHAGQPGYEVLTPFALGDGGQRILVNRGWVVFTGYRDRLPDISFSNHATIRITGRLADLPAAGLAS